MHVHRRTGPQYAYPAVRTLDFLSQFPNRSARTTICDEDLSDGLTDIAARLKVLFGDPCFESQPADMDPDTAGAQYECTVTEVRHRVGQPDEELRLFPQCGKGTLPCWHIEEDAAACHYTHTNPHLKLVIDRGTDVPSADTRLSVSCVTTASSGELK